MIDEPLLRAEDVARLLSIGRSKAYELLASGDIRSLRIGRSLRCTSKAMADFVQRQEEGAPQVGGAPASLAIVPRSA